MKDNVLKKEFQKRDVERLRNLVKGKHGDRTTMGIGYSGEVREDHKEGDVWEERGKTWTIRDGIKENITKLDKIKQAAIPLFCPKCSTAMKPHRDKQWYIINGHCFNCQVDHEHQLRKEGKFEEMQQQATNDHVDGITKDFEIWFDEMINTKESFVTEQGDVEKWDGSGKEQLLKQKQEALEYLQSLKK
jgi:DNA-directed RNA polymerase subunit M/transcription elongation factor TFIIS